MLLRSCGAAKLFRAASTKQASEKQAITSGKYEDGRASSCSRGIAAHKTNVNLAKDHWHRVLELVPSSSPSYTRPRYGQSTCGVHFQC